MLKDISSLFSPQLWTELTSTLTHFRTEQVMFCFQTAFRKMASMATDELEYYTESYQLMKTFEDEENEYKKLVMACYKSNKNLGAYLATRTEEQKQTVSPEGQVLLDDRKKCRTDLDKFLAERFGKYKKSKKNREHQGFRSPFSYISSQGQTHIIETLEKYGAVKRLNRFTKCGYRWYWHPKFIKRVIDQYPNLPLLETSPRFSKWYIQITQKQRAYLDKNGKDPENCMKIYYDITSIKKMSTSAIFKCWYLIGTMYKHLGPTVDIKTRKKIGRMLNFYHTRTGTPPTPEDIDEARIICVREWYSQHAISKRALDAISFEERFDEYNKSFATNIQIYLRAMEEWNNASATERTFMVEVDAFGTRHHDLFARLPEFLRNRIAYPSKEIFEAKIELECLDIQSSQPTLLAYCLSEKYPDFKNTNFYKDVISGDLYTKALDRLSSSNTISSKLIEKNCTRERMKNRFLNSLFDKPQRVKNSLYGKIYPELSEYIMNIYNTHLIEIDNVLQKDKKCISRMLQRKEALLMRRAINEFKRDVCWVHDGLVCEKDKSNLFIQTIQRMCPILNFTNKPHYGNQLRNAIEAKELRSGRV